jgi:O-acetylhomoserine/O-acetylserine sulfhydrylase-like pyridoxal-dependent enzyme
VSFVDNPDDPASWRAAVRPNTKAFFGETIANPKTDILDIKPTGPGRGKVHTGGLGVACQATEKT